MSFNWTINIKEFLNMKIYFTGILPTKFIVLLLSILFFLACGAVDPPMKDIPINLPLNSKFEIKGNKKTLFSKYSTHFTYYDRDEVLKDSIMFFEIQIPEKRIAINYKTYLFEKKSDSLTLKLDSVTYFTIVGKLFVAIDTNNLNFVYALKAEDYINLFKNAVINGDDTGFDHKKYPVYIGF
jgi:hypothetical protein